MLSKDKSSGGFSGGVSGSYSGPSSDRMSGGSTTHVIYERTDTRYTASVSHDSCRGNDSYRTDARIEHRVSDRVSVDVHGGYGRDTGPSGGAGLKVRF